MVNDIKFRRAAAVAAIISAPIGLGSFVLVLMAANFNPDMVTDLSDVIKLGATAAGYLHLAWRITDAFGYGLLLAPAALYLWGWLKPRSQNFVTLYALSGLAYILTAAIAVSAMAGVVPALMRTYASASGAQQEMQLAIFQSLFDLTYYGVGPLVWLFGGLWWLGIGAYLQQERRFLGVLTMVMGILSLVVWAEQAFRLDALIFVENPFMLSVPVWAVWLGVVIWRGAEEHAPALEPAAAD